jgi:hypothetical protein
MTERWANERAVAITKSPEFFQVTSYATRVRHRVKPKQDQGGEISSGAHKKICHAEDRVGIRPEHSADKVD